MTIRRLDEFDLVTARPVANPPNVRRLLEDAIAAHLDAAEALILALDEIDGDENLEDGIDLEIVCEDEGADLVALEVL